MKSHLLIEVQNEPHPRVRGGPLEGDYIFSQMHFHWGDNDTFGSEDKINHRSFPMELHMVFYKEAYNNVKEAVLHPDGLTVLAFFYELDRHQHPAYDEIMGALRNVTEPHTRVAMDHPFSFLNILPYDLRRYFTYRGSLTTPPCSEVVIWLDFEQPIRLAHEQVAPYDYSPLLSNVIATDRHCNCIVSYSCPEYDNEQIKSAEQHSCYVDRSRLRSRIEAFRELKSIHGKITHNFRPIQPIGDRVVFYNIDNSYFTYNEIDPDEEEDAPPTKSSRRKSRNKGSTLSARLFIVGCPSRCPKKRTPRHENLKSGKILLAAQSEDGYVKRWY
ncbi:unnamed protein product [Diatraea saccharalis]|uniref:Alpha-carbonic anhydrase domain-containing protein n=1 Tax=Diatraea saccharalis TaxID=40085 RepID=A0A9N9REB9_9NEOP|nr:unnamed protein product [Diatraea saccharalis]